MKSDIEDFVKNNREGFDDLTPNEKVWAEIEKSIPYNNDRKQLWIWRAAAIIFFCTSALLFFQPFGSVNLPTENRIARIEDSKLNNELAQVESFYIQMISEKRSLISTFQEEQNTEEQVGREYEDDLQKLSAMYEVLKKEFDNDPTKEVVDALVLNLLVRIDILNKKLAELETIEEAVIQEEPKEINA